MFVQKISREIWGGESGKYRLRDSEGNPIDQTPEDTCMRVAKGLAEIEESDKEQWQDKFFKLLSSGKMSGGGRIMANVGSGNHKRDASPINCVVIRQIPDSMSGIMQTAKESAMTLRAGSGVGYDFSPIRPKGAYVFGAGAETSGVISFMKIFDATCGTVMSGGGRRGAQMGCLDIQHPEVEDFITCKRQDGMLRYFNLSILITDKFMSAVEKDELWHLWFWEKTYEEVDPKLIKTIRRDDIPFRHPEYDYFSFEKEHTEVESGNCGVDTLFKKRIFKAMPARDLFDKVMKSTYDFAEPGFILIDKINKENNLHFVEIIRATNPCGEQPLAPNNSCLLGSMILPPYVSYPFTEEASFDWESFEKDVRLANRMLDNVVEINNLPLPELDQQLRLKRRHGLGFTGLGSLFNMMCMSYGDAKSEKFANDLAFTIAIESLRENIELAKEKGCAPILETRESREGILSSGYMKRILKEVSKEESNRLRSDIMKYGLRYSHATSIAPTGTMSLTWGNNCSNGIEPSFSNYYMRNIRMPGKKTKVQDEVMSYEYLLWREIFKDAPLPDYWRITDNLSVNDHIVIQSAVQRWVDSAVSKTINIPTDYPFDKFKDAYFEGWKKGLKGVTTFRFNPEAFSGVLVKKEDLESTEYVFVLEGGEEITVNGSDDIEYDGEIHNAANLFDALKEGMYGDM